MAAQRLRALAALPKGLSSRQLTMVRTSSSRGSDTPKHIQAGRAPMYIKKKFFLSIYLSFQHRVIILQVRETSQDDCRHSLPCFMFL